MKLTVPPITQSSAAPSAVKFATDHAPDFAQLGAKDIAVVGSTVQLTPRDARTAGILHTVLQPQVRVTAADGSAVEITISTTGPVAAPAGIADVAAAVAQLQGV